MNQHFKNITFWLSDPANKRKAIDYYNSLNESIAVRYFSNIEYSQLEKQEASSYTLNVFDNWQDQGHKNFLASLINTGHFNLIKLEDFHKIKMASNLFQKREFMGKILLIGIPSYLYNIFKSIFYWYGYECVFHNELDSIEKELKANPTLAIIDIDLSKDNHVPEKNKALRGKILSLLKYQLHIDPKFSSLVCKNFELGSLYDDINSKAKEISSSIFSYGELIIFLCDYLYNYNLSKTLNKIEKIWLKSNPQMNIYKTAKLSMSINLRNSKKTFDLLQDSTLEYLSLEKLLSDINSLNFIKNLFEQPVNLLKNSPDIFTRGLFSFGGAKGDSNNSSSYDGRSLEGDFLHSKKHGSSLAKSLLFI